MMYRDEVSVDRDGDRASGYIPTLDGWRAVAIAIVLADHTVNFGATSAHDLARWRVPPALGLHGVGIFFALSGFLITSRLLEEYRHGGSISLRNFYVRRAFRILPAALVVLAGLAALGAAGVLPINRAEVLGAALFYRNYLPSVYSPNGEGFFTAHYWSLAVEEHFYLLWPVLLIVGLRHRKALATGVLLACLVSAWRRIELAREIETYHRVLPTFFVRSDTRMDALFWGGVAALALDRPHMRAWLARYLTMPVWLGLVAIYMAIWMHFRTRPTCWEAIAAALLIIGTVVNPKGFIGRCFELSPMRWVGRLSYSLYLTNNAFIPFASIGILVTLGMVQRAPFNIVAVAISALLLHYLVERPMIRVGRRIAAPVGLGRREPSNVERPPTPIGGHATVAG